MMASNKEHDTCNAAEQNSAAANTGPATLANEDILSAYSAESLTRLCQFLSQYPTFLNAILSRPVPSQHNESTLCGNEDGHSHLNHQNSAVTDVDFSVFSGIGSPSEIPSRSPDFHRSYSRTPDRCRSPSPPERLVSDTPSDHSSPRQHRRKRRKLKSGSKSCLRHSALHEEGFSTGPDTDQTDIETTEPDSDASSIPVGSQYHSPNHKKESGKKYCFRDKKRGLCCLKGFRKLFNSSAAFDIKLRVGNEEFSCHKALLMASSDYFFTMFTSGLAEQSKDVVTINGIEPDVMKLIIKYFYKGSCQLTMAVVEGVFMAADYLQLPDLKTGCEQYMLDQLQISSSLDAFFFAERMNCQLLRQGALKSIMNDFADVANSAQFLKLSASQVSQLLTYDENNTKEDKIFQAAMKWLEFSVKDRKEHIYDVFSKIRYALMNKFYLSDIVLKNFMLLNDPRMKTMLDDVIQYMLMSERWIEFDVILEPRAYDKFERTIIHTWTNKSDSFELDAFEMYNFSESKFPSGYLTQGAVKRGLQIDVMPDDMTNSTMLTSVDMFYLAGGCYRHPGIVCTNKFYCWERLAEGDGYGFRELRDMKHVKDQFSMAQVDSHIYVIGGREPFPLTRCLDKDMVNGVECYDPDADTWTSVEPLPMALQNTCSVGFFGNLYVFGGKYNGRVFGKQPTVGLAVSKLLIFMADSAYCYLPAVDEWLTLSTMVTPRAWAGCTILNKKIYVIGGGQEIKIDQETAKTQIIPLSSVEIYDPITNTWEQGPELPEPLCGAGVLKYNATIYVLGGRGENGDSSHVYRLDLATKTWKRELDLNMGTVTQNKLSHLCSYGVIEFTPPTEGSCEQNEFTDFYNSDTSSS